MKTMPSGLFASSILTKTLAEEPVGTYDPIEQVWRDTGEVQAQGCDPFHCHVECSLLTPHFNGVCINGFCNCIPPG